MIRGVHTMFYTDVGGGARGVEFVDGVPDVGYGRRTTFRAPGDFTIELYEPSYVKSWRRVVPLRATPSTMTGGPAVVTVIQGPV